VKVVSGRNQNKTAQVQSRKDYFDWLAGTIQIDGVENIMRDTAFDDEKYRSSGIHLDYRSANGSVQGLKDEILLEVGFGDVTPNTPKDISSWAYDYAAAKVEIIDNRAIAVVCYDAGYTLVEKLQTISTKYRKQQEGCEVPKNFMCHYYDVYCLLMQPEIQTFIGTSPYLAHKDRRFRGGDNLVIAENEAFFLRDTKARDAFEKTYAETQSLYNRDRPTFSEILAVIGANAERF